MIHNRDHRVPPSHHVADVVDTTPGSDRQDELARKVDMLADLLDAICPQGISQAELWESQARSRT